MFADKQGGLGKHRYDSPRRHKYANRMRVALALQQPTGFWVATATSGTTTHTPRAVLIAVRKDVPGNRAELQRRTLGQSAEAVQGKTVTGVGWERRAMGGPSNVPRCPIAATTRQMLRSCNNAGPELTTIRGFQYFTTVTLQHAAVCATMGTPFPLSGASIVSRR